MNYFRRRALMTKLAKRTMVGMEGGSKPEPKPKQKSKKPRINYDLVPMGAYVKGPDGKNFQRVVRGTTANNQRKQFVRPAIGGEKRLHQVVVYTARTSHITNPKRKPLSLSAGR